MNNLNYHADSEIRINSKRVAGIIIKNDEILLMHRIKSGREFYSIPGGHSQVGENERETLIREIDEEASLQIISIQPAFSLKNHYCAKEDHYYTAEWASGTTRLGGEEEEKNCPENQYKLEWVKMSKIDSINLLPKAAKEWIVETIVK